MCASTSSEWNLQPFQDLVLPLPFKSQGIKVGDQSAGATVLEENGKGFLGFSLEQEKRYVMLLQPGSSFRQTSKHEIVLPIGSRKKSGHQVEDDRQGSLMVQGQLLRIKQGPIVLGALVPAEPIDDRAALVGVVI